jgi:hypothetical protein
VPQATRGHCGRTVCALLVVTAPPGMHTGKPGRGRAAHPETGRRPCRSAPAPSAPTRADTNDEGGTHRSPMESSPHGAAPDTATHRTRDSTRGATSTQGRRDLQPCIPDLSRVLRSRAR